MTATLTEAAHPASFRDPSGFIFRRDHTLYRQVNHTYQDHYDRLMSSGLYDALVKAGRLVPHREVQVPPADPERAYRIIQPDPVAFISYPYEWCFSQLKDAALLTLTVQKQALKFGLSLKDASAYNVQFVRRKPVLIDTLSFEICPEPKPWVAYRQFCQHFLAALALMAYRDVRLGQLLRVHIDGIPLDLASALLPRRTRLNPSLMTHLHLHAKSQAHYADKGGEARGRTMSQYAVLGLLDSLEGAIRKLTWRPPKTQWGEYYQDTSYTPAAFEDKRATVGRLLEVASPRTVWDLGGNVGVFSRLAGTRGVPTVCMDSDPVAVERNYLSQEDGSADVLPLLMDLTSPSPGLGWANQERMSLAERGPADTVLALALIHHLAISNNVPFPTIAAFLAGLCRTLIIEFVPKEDPQVQRLLRTREDIFSDYSQDAFERQFGQSFRVVERAPVRESPRVLYLLEKS